MSYFPYLAITAFVVEYSFGVQLVEVKAMVVQELEGITLHSEGISAHGEHIERLYHVVVTADLFFTGKERHK